MWHLCQRWQARRLPCPFTVLHGTETDDQEPDRPDNEPQVREAPEPLEESYGDALRPAATPAVAPYGVLISDAVGNVNAARATIAQQIELLMAIGAPPPGGGPSAPVPPLVAQPTFTQPVTTPTTGPGQTAPTLAQPTSNVFLASEQATMDAIMEQFVNISLGVHVEAEVVFDLVVGAIENQVAQDFSTVAKLNAQPEATRANLNEVYDEVNETGFTGEEAVAAVSGGAIAATLQNVVSGTAGLLRAPPATASTPIAGKTPSTVTGPTGSIKTLQTIIGSGGFKPGAGVTLSSGGTLGGGGGPSGGGYNINYNDKMVELVTGVKPSQEVTREPALDQGNETGDFSAWVNTESTITADDFVASLLGKSFSGELDID